MKMSLTMKLMKNGKGWIKKRTKKKIIRYRNFKLHQDPENYYREQLMLFLPWSNEEEDLIYINHEETFELHKDLIRQKRSEYVHREANEFEKAFEEHTERGNEDDINDTNIEYDQDKNEFLIYETGNNQGDIFVEMGINTRTEKVEHFNGSGIRRTEKNLAEINKLLSPPFFLQLHS